MRARFKAPSGTGVLNIADDATLGTLLDEIRSNTGIQSFSVKYGPPMAMKVLDISNKEANAKSMGLNGETLTIVPKASPPPRPEPPRGSQMVMKDSVGGFDSNPGPEDIIIPWPEREGTLRKFFTFLRFS